MKRARGIWGCLLLAAGCVDADERAFGPILTDVFAEIGAEFQRLIDGHPAALRATAGLECDSEPLCDEQDKPVATACSLQDPAFDAEFRTRFVDCMLSCHDGVDCFEHAASLPLPPPAPGEPRGDCIAATQRCEVFTDACDALAVLRDETLAQGISSCNDAPCSELLGCYRDVLLEGTGLEDAGSD